LAPEPPLRTELTHSSGCSKSKQHFKYPVRWKTVTINGMMKATAGTVWVTHDLCTYYNICIMC